MSPHGYVQLFLFALLCTDAISAENSTCSSPRAQSNIDLNQVYGIWFLGQLNAPANATLQKSQCLTMTVKKINETTLELSLTMDGEASTEVLSIESAENAGTWYNARFRRTVQVIYLSADGTTMALASCMSNREEPLCILMGKTLPISSEKIEEVVAGISGSHCHFTWTSEATCTST